MRLFRLVALPVVILVFVGCASCQDVELSENKLSSEIDGTCSAEKESCGCDKTSRGADISKTDDTDVSIDGNSKSEATLHRKEDVEFSRKNQMVLIKGKFELSKRLDLQCPALKW